MIDQPATAPRTEAGRTLIAYLRERPAAVGWSLTVRQRIADGVRAIEAEAEAAAGQSESGEVAQQALERIVVRAQGRSLSGLRIRPEAALTAIREEAEAALTAARPAEGD